MVILQRSRWKVAGALLALAAVAGPTLSLAQTTWTWRIELYRQDSGSVDQFAPFCGNPDCDGTLTGQTVCVTGPGISTPICNLANQNNSLPAVANTAVFTGLSTSAGTFIACVQNETYQLFGASIGLTVPPPPVPPRCVSRSAVTTPPDITNAMYLFKLGTVRVEKFEDLNGNGVRDEGEGPLKDFKFEVTDTDCGTLTTGDDGRASCTSADIKIGQTYEICELPKSGWEVTGAYWGDDKDPQGQTDGPCVTTGALDQPVDWTVKFGNQRSTDSARPVPAAGLLGLGALMLLLPGFGLLFSFRRRR